MRQLLFLLAVTVVTNLAHAAIPIGADGSGTISFGTFPLASEWSTKSIPGVDTSLASVNDLLNAVQTNASASITNQLLDGAGANPPGQNTLAAWTTGGTASLWTRPTANAAILLMATLQNTIGVDQSILRIIYTLGQSGSTPAEQAPAHQVYYSLSGAPGTWINIPALSGGSTGVKSNTVALAGIWVSGAPLYVLWVDDNATGGVDRGYSIDNISFAGNTRPTLDIVPNFRHDVLRPLLFRALATDSEANQLTYSLAPGAPATARINATNGLFVWRPERSDADTTNSITIQVRELGLGVSGLSVTQTFTVFVLDYIELTVSSVVAEVGRRTNVVIECVSTAPLVNLSFNMQLAGARLTNLNAVNLSPSIAFASFDFSQPDRASFNFSASDGQLLRGTQQLARLQFDLVAGQSSAFIPLQLTEVASVRAQPGNSPSVLANHGRVVAVNGQPLLEAFGAGSARSLTLYGKPGTNYQLETSINSGASWQPWQSVTLSSLLQSINTSAHTNATIIFYRARDGAAAPPSLLPQAPTEFKAAAKLKKRKITAAAKRQKRLSAQLKQNALELLP